MNKKIYFNDKFIEFSKLPAQSSHYQSFEIYRQADDASLKKIVSSFLDPSNLSNILISGQEFEPVFDKLKKTGFHYIEAAGGFIEKDQEFLFIHRHGRWDLPKGKLEKKESVEQAAVRECEEECGVKDLLIRRGLSPTFHVYPHKNGYALKQTYWFHMQTGFTGALRPQIAEDIHEARWFGRNDIQNVVLKNTYFTITDVVNEGLSLVS